MLCDKYKIGVPYLAKCGFLKSALVYRRKSVLEYLLTKDAHLPQIPTPRDKFWKARFAKMNLRGLVFVDRTCPARGCKTTTNKVSWCSAHAKRCVDAILESTGLCRNIADIIVSM